MCLSLQRYLRRLDFYNNPIRPFVFSSVINHRNYSTALFVVKHILYYAFMANVILIKLSYARFNLSMNLKNTRAKLLILSQKKKPPDAGTRVISIYPIPI